MPVAEEEHVSRHGANTIDDARGARGDIVEGLAADDAVAEQRPSGPLLLDLVARLALVRAVVPLDQIGIDDRDVPIPGEHGCLARPLQRAHEHRGECHPASVAARARAPASCPCAVSGMSLRPVCRLMRLHSVSPWRTMTTRCDGSGAPPAPRDRSCLRLRRFSSRARAWRRRHPRAARRPPRSPHRCPARADPPRTLHCSSGASPSRIGSKAMPGLASMPGTLLDDIARAAHQIGKVRVRRHTARVTLSRRVS